MAQVATRLELQVLVELANAIPPLPPRHYHLAKVLTISPNAFLSAQTKLFDRN